MKRYTILSSRSSNSFSSFTIHSTIRNPFPARAKFLIRIIEHMFDIVN